MAKMTPGAQIRIFCTNGFMGIFSTGSSVVNRSNQAGIFVSMCLAEDESVFRFFWSFQSMVDSGILRVRTPKIKQRCQCVLILKKNAEEGR